MYYLTCSNFQKGIMSIFTIHQMFMKWQSQLLRFGSFDSLELTEYRTGLQGFRLLIGEKIMAGWFPQIFPGMHVFLWLLGSTDPKWAYMNPLEMKGFCISKIETSEFRFSKPGWKISDFSASWLFCRLQLRHNGPM